MDTIDHRILVHASPMVVWNYISNIENNPYWQVDCRDVTFLTSAHIGQGVRWRQKPESGRDQIIEITAWYNQLGYEYVIVDGANFARNQGRIRLQEIAEGTIIQWTFNYELGGLLGGLRNALIARRNIENAMVDSLWTLWRHLSNSEETDFRSRTLMRDAPDVEARAHYEPRHPSNLSANDVIHDNSPVINEPPIEQDDTRPRPAVTPSEEDNFQEPDFLSEISTSEMEKSVLPEEPSIFAPPPEPRNTSPEPPVAEPPKIDVEDTSQISVFDLFGVTKPSETQEIAPVPMELTEQAKPVVEPKTEQTTVTAPTQPIPEPKVIFKSGERTGRRYILRQRLVNLRRPE